jgi:hypothetical protein
MANRSIIFTVGVALILSSALALAFRPSFYPPYAEGRMYVDMAGGNYSHIYSYYGGRVLHPLTAGFLAHLFHRPVDAALFIKISAFSLIALFVLLAISYGLDYSYAGGLWLFILVTPTLVDSYRNYYWHDLFYAALCALFFLALRANPWLALPVMFLLYLTRESTVVLVAALVIIAVLRGQWRLCFAAAVVGVIAMRLDAALVARSLPNNEYVSMPLLDLLKVPYNFMHNICGVELWTNTIAATATPPIWTMPVPSWLHIGHIREVGYSGFFWESPARTLLMSLTAFGILPLAAIRSIYHNGRSLLRERLDIVTALVYGGLTFVLAPLVGTQPERYILYAWPVLWLFGVGALDDVFRNPRKRIEILALSLLVAWIPATIRLVTGPPVEGPESVSNVASWGLVVSLALAIFAYAGAWRIFESAPAVSPAGHSAAVSSSVP